MKKIFLTAFISAMSLMCFAQDYGLKVFTFDDYPYITAQAMSTDGKYVTGSIGFASEGTFVFDTETNDMSVHFSESLYGSDGRGVSDTGVAACYDDGAMTFSITGEEIRLEGDTESGNIAEGITPDGTIVVGAVTKTDSNPEGFGGINGHACYWKDAKAEMLEEPSGEVLGLKTLFDETETSYDGSHATKINEDGSVIVGYFIDRWASHPCIAWTLNDDGSYTCDPICKGYWEEDRYWDDDTSKTQADFPYFQFSASGLSKNGKYISLNLSPSTFDDDPTQIGRFNIDTRDLEVTKGDTAFTCKDVANDGTIIASSGGGHACIWRPGESAPISFQEAYPLVEEFATFDTYGWHTPMAISPDGRYILGFVTIADYSLESDYYEFYVFDTVQYENATGIVSVTNDNIDASQAIYSIDGRQLNGLQRGINIVKKNGKISKYLVR
ncbi:MAG: hypothetical protein LUC91_03585 [Prevotella sp.]|nr:hypothetical protein [Prevotella sp.]